jgi:hypothetical protein
VLEVGETGALRRWGTESEDLIRDGRSLRDVRCDRFPLLPRLALHGNIERLRDHLTGRPEGVLGGWPGQPECKWCSTLKRSLRAAPARS